MEKQPVTLLLFSLAMVRILRNVNWNALLLPSIQILHDI
jgi:hypothetical protein